MTTYNFFVYCPDGGFDVFETLDDALDAADARIHGYLADCWSEEVTNVCVGKITHRAKMCDQVFPDGEINEDGIDEAGAPWDPDCDYKCNYKMLPVESKNPAEPVIEQAPYAYEYGLDNGDGTFSVVINKGSFAQLKENEFGYLPPFDTASKEHPVTPLYLHPQSAPYVDTLVEALERISNMDSMSYHSLESAKIVARKAITAYRKGGDV